MAKRKLIIAFLGTDGSGKTTIMQMVLPDLEKRIGRKFIIHHLKPDLLPPLGRLRGVNHEAGWVCTNPHGSKPSGFLGSCFRLAYLTLDYVLGYWFKVRPKIKSPDVAGWIFDRYAYDMLIDPRRFRLKLPHWMIKMALAVIPKPDVVVCLGGDAEKIHTRKPETPTEEVVRQVAELKRFCAGNNRAVWIDTTTSIEASCAAAMAAMSGIWQ